MSDLDAEQAQADSMGFTNYLRRQARERTMITDDRGRVVLEESASATEQATTQAPDMNKLLRQGSRKRRTAE